MAKARCLAGRLGLVGQHGSPIAASLYILDTTIAPAINTTWKDSTRRDATETPNGDAR